MGKRLEMDKKIWHNKSIPENKDEIIEKISNHYKEEKSYEDGYNIGIKQILSFIVFNETEIRTMVITPSGLAYDFKSNLNELDSEDIMWWSFALRHYKNYIHNNSTKNKICETFNINIEAIKFKVFLNKQKIDDINITTMDLFNCFYADK